MKLFVFMILKKAKKYTFEDDKDDYLNQRIINNFL